eukprot:gene7897-8753_t
MAGILSYAEFKEQCFRFINKSICLRDGWEKRIAEQGVCREYMLRKSTAASQTTHRDREANEDFDNEFDIDVDIIKDFEDVSEKTVTTKEDTSIHFEHHILYNESYNVPVLYFFASTSNGKSLTLEEVWNCVPLSFKNALSDKWSFITQTEHPFLGCPCFFVHPCHTGKMMENLLQRQINNDNYLTVWLSAVGPVAGLHLSLEYFKKSQNEKQELENNL